MGVERLSARTNTGFNLKVHASLLALACTNLDEQSRYIYRRLVHLWGARAKHAVIMRIASYTVPRRATYVADGTTRGYHFWPTLGPR